MTRTVSLNVRRGALFATLFVFIALLFWRVLRLNREKTAVVAGWAELRAMTGPDGPPPAAGRGATVRREARTLAQESMEAGSALGARQGTLTLAAVLTALVLAVAALTVFASADEASLQPNAGGAPGSDLHPLLRDLSATPTPTPSPAVAQAP